MNSSLSSLNLQDILAKTAARRQEIIDELTGKRPTRPTRPAIQIQPLRKPVTKELHEVDPVTVWESEGGNGMYFRQLDEAAEELETAVKEFLEKETTTIPVPYHHPIARRIELSEEQRVAVECLVAGKSFCLIGKAGTGKTTTVKEGVYALESSHKVAPMWDVEGHKYLSAGSIGVVCVAFTNRAINNISKSFDLGSTQINFMTIHKLLEYIREDYSYEDPETKELRSSSRFVPSRHEMRKLPRALRTIIIEEASMVSVDLWTKLKAATNSGTQFVFLGDLQQLPPPYGDGILGYKLNELPCLELTKIYRQAAENPIISLAWDISRGEKLTKDVLEAKYGHYKSVHDPIRITFFQKKIAPDMATISMGTFFCNLIDRGVLDPMNDIILIPYNGDGKNRRGEDQLGTIPINKRIAQHLSSGRKEQTYEIIAGFQKHYYAVGDKVLYNKKEGVVTKINKNGKYIGKTPLPPSVDLHRDGTYHPKDKSGATITPENMSSEDVDKYLLQVMEGEGDVQNQASHIMHIRLLHEQMEDGSTETEISTRGEYSNLLLAYAITIHKAQGSEWNKVFLLLHNSHYNVNREMLYTSVTRASKQIFCMCEADSFVKAIGRQRIPGIELQEKILWFKKKIEEMIKKQKEKVKKATTVFEEEEDDEDN